MCCYSDCNTAVPFWWTHRVEFTNVISIILALVLGTTLNRVELDGFLTHVFDSLMQMWSVEALHFSGFHLLKNSSWLLCYFAKRGVESSNIAKRSSRNSSRISDAHREQQKDDKCTTRNAVPHDGFTKTRQRRPQRRKRRIKWIFSSPTPGCKSRQK